MGILTGVTVMILINMMSDLAKEIIDYKRKEKEIEEIKELLELIKKSNKK